MLIGYCRVSTDDQTLDLQRDALQAVGCERIFEDKASGSKADRPGLKAALGQLRKGDTLVVWRLDRLGRSLKDLIMRAETLSEHGVGLRSLQENIDTDSASGQLIFHIFGALAQFERTQAGLTAARARGRPRALSRTTTVRSREWGPGLRKLSGPAVTCAAQTGRTQDRF